MGTDALKPVVPVELDRNGFNELRMCRLGPMLYNKNDIYVGGALRKYGEFSWAEMTLLQQLVLPGQVVVEAGANIGAHTVGLAKHVGATGAVYAYEPQRIVFQTLCANLALNQCTNVYAFQEALGAADGKISVPALDPAVRSNFGGISLPGTAAGEGVPVRSLDSLALSACHLLKADVEGMETEVLKGAVHTIETHRPYLYLENDREERSKELIEMVFSLDYDVFWHLPKLFNPDNFARDPENIFAGLISINMICVPGEQKRAIEGARRVVSADDTWRGGSV